MEYSEDVVENFIDYLSEFYSITEVSGGNQIKLDGDSCPLCGEERSDLRLYVNSKTGAGKCFHCNKGFFPALFISKKEGCSIREAEKILENKDDGWAREKPKKEEKEQSLIFPESVWAITSKQAMEYLTKRRICEAAIKHFRLMQATKNVIIGGTEYFTRGRLIIPIFDVDGKLSSWQARDMSGYAKQRYIFPPGFKGRESLYNANAIQPHPSYLIICEGAFDLFGWWVAGFKNVVATFGKKISEEQMAIVNRLNPKVVYIAWDTDANWLKYEFYEKYGYKFDDVRIVDLGGKDADELGSTALAQSITNAVGYSWEDKIKLLL